MDASSFYDSLVKYGFLYGPEFRVIEQIFGGDEEAIAYIRPSDDKHQRAKLALGFFEMSYLFSKTSIFMEFSLSHIIPILSPKHT